MVVQLKFKLILTTELKLKFQWTWWGAFVHLAKINSCRVTGTTELLNLLVFSHQDTYGIM
jgi:hypothetical protein